MVGGGPDRGLVVPVGAGRKVPRHPRTIQIDGDRDRVIRADDSMDLLLFEDSVRQVILPGVQHDDFNLAPDPGSDPRRAEVRARLADAIGAAVGGALGASAPSRGAGFGMAPPAAEPAPTLYRSAFPPGPGGPADEGQIRSRGGLTTAVDGDGPGARALFGAPAGGPVVGDAGPEVQGPGDDGADAANVIFLIHGIRDYGSWHSAMEEALAGYIAQAPGTWKVVRIEYGYFSALQFLLPVQQNRLVDGFVDRYLDEMIGQLHAILPEGRQRALRFHIATHSNGCLVMGHAIRKNDRVGFSRVFQAGCVLNPAFWRDHADRAYFVRNDCATHDWPVGVLCQILGGSRLGAYRLLGTAGVTGFAEATGGATIQNNRYFTGDHGAALEAARLDSIARYLVTGVNRPGCDSPRRDRLIIEHLAFLGGLALVGVIALAIGLLLATSGGGGAAVALGAVGVVFALILVFVLLNV